MQTAATQKFQPKPWMRGDWLVACALGLGADGAIASVVTRHADSTSSNTMFALAGLLQGAVLGLFQARVLRRRLPRLNTYAWVAVTALAASSLWVAGALAWSPLSANLRGSPSLQLTIDAVLGLTLLAGGVAGAVFGIAQSYALRRCARNRLRFILVSAIGWAAAAPFLGAALVVAQLGTAWWHALGAGLACGLLGGVPLGSVISVFLTALEPGSKEPFGVSFRNPLVGRQHEDRNAGTDTVMHRSTRVQLLGWMRR